MYSPPSKSDKCKWILLVEPWDGHPPDTQKDQTIQICGDVVGLLIRDRGESRLLICRAKTKELIWVRTVPTSSLINTHIQRSYFSDLPGRTFVPECLLVHAGLTDALPRHSRRRQRERKQDRCLLTRPISGHLPKTSQTHRFPPPPPSHQRSQHNLRRMPH